MRGLGLEPSPSDRKIALYAIFKRAMCVHGVPADPASLMERPRQRRTLEITLLSAPDVHALPPALPPLGLRPSRARAAAGGPRPRWARQCPAIKVVPAVGRSMPRYCSCRGSPPLEEPPAQGRLAIAAVRGAISPRTPTPRKRSGNACPERRLFAPLASVPPPG